MGTCATLTCFADAPESGGFCASCQQEIDRLLGGGAKAYASAPPARQLDLPARLMDATAVARSVYNYFYQLLVTDGVLSRDAHVFSLQGPTFDDLSLDRAAALTEAFKSQVVNEYVVAVRDAVDRARGISGLHQKVTKKSSVRACYGCGRKTVGENDIMCDTCLSEEDTLA